MRGLAVTVLTVLIATPALAGGGMFHDRMPLPPPSPAYGITDGDRAGRFSKDYGPPEHQSNLQRFAEDIGAGRNNGHSDFFRYSLNRDDNGNAQPNGAALAGTFSSGAAQLQIRWNTGQ